MRLRIGWDQQEGRLGKSPTTGGFFINQSLSFSPPALPHSPTQQTQLPIKSVGACRQRILPLMQTHAHSRVCACHAASVLGFVGVCTVHLCSECQFKEILTFWYDRSKTDFVNQILKQEWNIMTCVWIYVLCTCISFPKAFNLKQ